MADPEDRRAALTAAACLIGPTIPPALVVNRPLEAATALTRMADLLLPWLEDVSTTAQPGDAATASQADPATGEEDDNGRTRPRTETK